MSAPRRTVPVLLDDAIDAVADIEQARATAKNHRRLALHHEVKAKNIEKEIDERVVVAAEALTFIRERRRMLVAARPARPHEPGRVVELPVERRRGERRREMRKAA